MSGSKAASLADPDFRWDGTTSDLAQQYYHRFIAGDSLPQRKYTKIPAAVEQRLAASGTSMSKLPGLLQRALVWDTGFVENGKFDGSKGGTIELVGVKTENGVSMAEIAVTRAEYETKCKTFKCNGPGYTWYQTNYCNGTQSVSVSHCLVDPFEDGGRAAAATWAIGGDDTTLPAMRVLRHTWIDYDNKTEFLVEAIHTAEIEPEFGRCVYNAADMTKVGPGSLVIPCESQKTISSERKSVMKQPKQSDLVTAWLQEYAQTNVSTVSPTPALTQQEKGTNSVVIILPVAAVVLVALGIIIWCCRRRARSNSKAEETQIQSDAVYRRAQTPQESNAVSLDMAPRKKDTKGDSTHASTYSSESRPGTNSLDGDLELVYGAVIQTLLDDSGLTGKQIPFETLEFANEVSHGAYGEVWVGYRNGEIVAIKRLLRNKYRTRRDVEAFAQEIQLSARLHHPNIVRFIGMSWNKPEDLCMVLEFLPAGDLSKVLRESGGQLTWSQHKLGMVRGLVSAAAYLHSQSPAIIHRDLKSKNVLLTNTLEPKVIDFGVSRRNMDMTMTAGVGTPYWTAPEVLEGLRYTEKSDIYSLGVLLTEIDTCQMPFYDVPNDSGGMIHLKILNEVVSGNLRPTVSDSCPDTIRKVVASCLNKDPAERPTAVEVLWMLA